MALSIVTIPTAGVGDVNHLYVSALRQTEQMHAAYLARVKQEFVTQMASGSYVADCAIPYPSPAHEVLASVVFDIFEKMIYCQRSIDHLQTSLKQEAINNNMVVPSDFVVEKESVDATLAAQTQQIPRGDPALVEDVRRTAPETHSVQQEKDGLRDLSSRSSHLTRIKARLADLEHIKDVVVTIGYQFSEELSNEIYALATHHVSKKYRRICPMRADYYEQILSTIDQMAPSCEEVHRSEQACIQPLIESIFTAPSFEGVYVPCVALIEKTANTLRLSSQFIQQKTVDICPEVQGNMRNYFKQSFDLFLCDDFVKTFFTMEQPLPN